MKKMILLNPGPVNVTESVRHALLRPDICHREKEFSDLLEAMRKRLVRIFGNAASHTAVFFAGSGTTALEAMLSSSAAPGKKILVLSNGVYGDRIQKILELHKIPVKTLKSPIGDFPNLEQIDSILKNDLSIESVAMVHHETSSGMLNPIEKISHIAKKRGKNFMVDAISSLGAEAIDFRKTPVDFMAGTAGKCLHGFPGVSFVFVAKKQVERLRGIPRRTLCLDLLSALELQLRNDTAFTPPVQVFYAFDQALKELEKQGLKNRILDYAQKSALLEKGFEKLNLRFLVSKESRSHVLTALWTPNTLSYQTLHDELKKRGFVIYAGQSELKDKIFRVSNLGAIKMADLKRFLKALESILT